jgi:hypothetical protein
MEPILEIIDSLKSELIGKLEGSVLKYQDACENFLNSFEEIKKALESCDDRGTAVRIRNSMINAIKKNKELLKP